jgi:hypothetical protein
MNLGKPGGDVVIYFVVQAYDSVFCTACVRDGMYLL